MLMQLRGRVVLLFFDIHPEYLTIDETLIEAAIWHKTTKKLAIHVLGNPSNIEDRGSIELGISRLNEIEILPMRYYLPSLTSLLYSPKITIVISESVCERTFCLPLYYALHKDVVKFIVRMIY